MIDKFIGFVSSGITPYVIAGIAVLILGFAGYFYWSQSKIEDLVKAKVAYEITIQTQQQALQQLGVDIEVIKQVNAELAEIERDNADAASKLADKLSQLKEIVKEKPGIVQDLVNKASKERNRCFALATGAKPEKKETNSVCPHLLKVR